MSYKICPQCATHEANALQKDDLALKPDEPQTVANLLQALVCNAELQPIVFMVAWDEDHRARPISKALQTKIWHIQPRER